ncbi:MAG: FAD-dependent monooxygenase, partial [Parachlamydiaceae bacterium]
YGSPSSVLEQAPQFRVEGAGIQFCPNTFKILDYLGLSKNFAKVAFFPDLLCYRDGVTDEEYIRLPLGKEIVERFNHPFGSFRRDDMLRVFVEACQNEPLIKLVTEAKIKMIEETEHEVHAITNDGKKFSGDILVGSDGIWSVARKYVIGEDAPRISGQIIYRGVVKREILPQSDLDNIIHYVIPNAHLVHYPVGVNGYVNISAIFQSDRIPDYRETKGKPEELNAWFQHAGEKVKTLLSFVDTSRMWTLCDYNPMRNWSKGRVVLLGDSAHATLPYMTSGAGMAVEDAFVFAKMIDRHGLNYKTAFKDYEEERYLRTSYVQLMSRAYGEAHHAQGVARTVRNAHLATWTKDEIFNWVSFLYNGIDVK